MIISNGIEKRTRKQWNKLYRDVKEVELDNGETREWYYTQRLISVENFYSEDQTRPYTEEEIVKAKAKERELRKSRKERLSCCCCGVYFGRYARKALNKMGICRICAKPHTAWQWLSRYHRVPMKGEKSIEKYPCYFDKDLQEWVITTKAWYYYFYSQTEMVTDEEYERLKEIYIEKFGGWEKIDLENTSYDGRIWW